MLIDTIRQMKAKLSEQGVNPTYLWCNTVTRYKIIKGVNGNINAIAFSIEGLEIKLDENVPTGQIIISDNTYDQQQDIPHRYEAPGKLN